ncbi:MAG: CCDC90 family protein [Desulfovibrio sp.]|jgi:hypothetical protein|nr:CCDC90 family protein [Desulfovibrio sp.]
MASVSVTFDTLGFFEKLKAAGVPEQQAKVQVEIMQEVVCGYGAASRKDLASKGDIQELGNELHNVKHELLKWIIGAMLVQITISIALFALK